MIHGVRCSCFWIKGLLVWILWSTTSSVLSLLFDFILFYDISRPLPLIRAIFPLLVCIYSGLKRRLFFSFCLFHFYFVLDYRDARRSLVLPHKRQPTPPSSVLRSALFPTFFFVLVLVFMSCLICFSCFFSSSIRPWLFPPFFPLDLPQLSRNTALDTKTGRHGFTHGIAKLGLLLIICVSPFSASTETISNLKRRRRSIHTRNKTKPHPQQAVQTTSLSNARCRGRM